MKVNKRYTAAKRDYRSYSLHQLLEILRHEDNDVSGYAQNLNEAFLQHEIYRLNKRVEKLDQQSQMWYEKYTDTLMKLYDKKIREYYNEYKILESDSQTEINQLREQKHALKASLKRGDTDNITYQRTIIPINKRIEEINFNLTQFRYEHLYETFPGEDDISFDIIKRYIYNNKLKK